MAEYCPEHRVIKKRGHCALCLQEAAEVNKPDPVPTKPYAPPTVPYVLSENDRKWLSRLRIEVP